VTKASCHCGAVVLEVKLTDGLNTARRCTCSFCMRRGAVAVSAKVEDVSVVKGADKLSKYSFNTHSAQHYFCSVCGVYTHHKRRSNPNEMGINAACIEGVHIPDLDPVGWVDGVNHPSDAKS